MSIFKQTLINIQTTEKLFQNCHTEFRKTSGEGNKQVPGRIRKQETGNLPCSDTPFSKVCLSVNDSSLTVYW